MQQNVDFVVKCNEFLDQMELCKTENELDALCRKECLLHYRSKSLQREVYRKRGEIISGKKTADYDITCMSFFT